ncbi:unnamed protein product [Urochloa humidicola]
MAFPAASTVLASSSSCSLASPPAEPTQQPSRSPTNAASRCGRRPSMSAAARSSIPVRRGHSTCLWAPAAGYGAARGAPCTTGDCTGELSCRGLGNPPTTLAEYTIGSSGGAQQNFYDISIIDGYNLAMDFSCSTGKALKCREQGCADAVLFPDDPIHACRGNSNYQVTFCPASAHVM